LVQKGSRRKELLSTIAVIFGLYGPYNLAENQALSFSPIYPLL